MLDENATRTPPSARLAVVRAAIAKRTGDHDAYQVIADGWLGAEELAIQVDALFFGYASTSASTSKN